MHRDEKEAEQKKLRYFFAASTCFKDLLRNNHILCNLKILAAPLLAFVPWNTKHSRDQILEIALRFQRTRKQRGLVLVVALRLSASPRSLFRLKFLNFVTKNYYAIGLKKTKSFIRHAVYAGLIFTLAFSLSGCALIGLLLRLAPLAAIMVEYSPPVQTEDEQIICVKSLRYIEQNGEDARIVKSEYFLVVLDDKGIEISSEPLGIGQEYFLTENFSIEKNDKNIFTLYFANEKVARKWKFEVGQQAILIIAQSNPLFTSLVA